MLDDWSPVTIGGKRADVFDPPGALPCCVVYLHSLAEESPATDPVFTTALAKHRLRCVAPHGGWCWWADRICSEFDPAVTPERYLLDVLAPAIQMRWGVGPRGIALVGTEMGGQGALRIAFKHPTRFPVAASVSGALDCHDWYGRGTPLDDMYESRERCRLDSAVLHIDGHHWPPHVWFCCEPTNAACYRGNDRLHEKLAAVGVPHVADLETTVAGSYTDRMVPVMMAFVAAGLESESRRLM